ncbi:unnamed protein product [Blepharisma stoltei]|uniref:Uncharacterized protein n=1 Tax=Blepharisma stoltei TaxID=1481888 RepID=A0AAU9IP96_9CILI|nr:unnamed protein product [Blepharisma stoltei]
MLASKIFRGIKVFTKEEVLNPAKNYKDLYELAGQYRCKGVGFHFWRSTWPPNSYYTITKMDLKDPSHGKAWGILTWKGKKGVKEEKIASPLKKGTWRFKIPELKIEPEESNKGQK